MKLKMVTGCTTDSLTIDGKEEIDLTDDERADAWNKVCGYLIDNGEHKYLNEFLQFVLTHHGEYGCSTEPCGQCGDYVETYKLEI
jgi:hypothetical protein